MQSIRRTAYVALLLGFAQILFGAIVRITGSGMGCGDHWPDCYGAFTPGSVARNSSESLALNGGHTLLVEISHRYGAAALSIAIIALLAVAWVKRNEPGVRGPGGVLRASLLALLLVIIAALFGAATVKMELQPLVVATHLAIAMSLLAVLVVAVVRAGGLGATTIPARYQRTLRSARAETGLTFLALVFGALTANTAGAAFACQGFPWCTSVAANGSPLYIQVAHRIIAFLLLGHLIGMVVGIRKRGETRAIRIAAWSALGIVLLQIVVAASMVEMHLPATLRSLHQAIGTALWLSVVALAALAAGTRELTDIETIVYESPSRGKFATPEGVST